MSVTEGAVSKSWLLTALKELGLELKCGELISGGQQKSKQHFSLFPTFFLVYVSKAVALPSH